MSIVQNINKVINLLSDNRKVTFVKIIFGGYYTVCVTDEVAEKYSEIL